MIRINLLPHREIRRERRKKEFVGLAIATAVASGVVAVVVGAVINQMIAVQAERNTFLKDENAKLDAQIKEIANLRAEIDGLRARQQAVENLQSDRTMPVHLLDELVRVAPDGLYLRQVKQEDMKVTLIGHAQSNERVSELLRNLAYHTPWLEKPELGEIKLVMLAAPAGTGASREGRRAYEFTLNALLKRPESAAPAQAAALAAAGAAGTHAAAGSGAPTTAAVAPTAVAAAPSAAPSASGAAATSR